MKTSILCNKITPVDAGVLLFMPQQDKEILLLELAKKPRRQYVVTVEAPERDDGGMRGLFWSLVRLLALESYGESGADAEESIYQGLIEAYAPPLSSFRGHIGRRSWSRCDTKGKCQLIEGAIVEVCACGMNYQNAVSVVNLMMEWRNWRYRQKEDPVIHETADAYRANTPICEACNLRPGQHLAHINSRGAGAEAFQAWNIFHFCQPCHMELQHQKGWGRMVELYPHLIPKIDKAREKFKGGTNA
jgi:hypothetical protein